MKVVLAVNHWHTAIQSHRANHPEVRHICAKIDDIDPRHDNLPPCDILMASPECTHHSNARGGRPMEDQKRATPWHICVWAEAKRPKYLVIENVREFRDWGPLSAYGRPLASRKGETYQAWLNALRALGYTLEDPVLNSADYGEATKRSRLFIIGRRGPIAPTLPKPTHVGRWRGAHEIIDWSIPCPSIFTRKRPLADKTLLRILAGLEKFVGPFAVTLRATSGAPGSGGTTRDLDQPLGTVTAGGTHHALAVPFQFKLIGRNAGASKSVQLPLPTIVAARENHGIAMPFVIGTGHTGTTGRASYVYDPTDPLRTVTGREEHGVVMPYVVGYHGGDDFATRNSSCDQPLPTVDTNPRFGVAMPYMLDVNYGDGDRSPGGRVHSVENPLGTVTSKRGKALAFPFFTEYYGTGGAASTDDPLCTITSKDRFGLAAVFPGKTHYDALRKTLSNRDKDSPGMRLIAAMERLGVADIGFRMLVVQELAAAQGFPLDYLLFGTQAEQIKQIGNAVPPGFTKAICTALGDAA